jgi:hypothetical protein
MALALTFGIALSSDGETLTISETTGTYNGARLGGWGSPNPATTDATTATITISLRASDGTYGTETTVNVFDDTTPLPSSIGGSTTITATQAGYDDTYADGIYKIVYTVTGTSGATPFSTSVTRYDVLRNSIAVAYQEKTAAYSACSCNCSELKENLECMALMMRLLKSAECCGKLDEIQLYLDKLTALAADECGC